MEEKKGKRWNACWPDETDLTALKSLAHTFLYLEIQPTKMSPLVVKHPFTDSGITAIRDENNSIQPADLLNNQQALDCWRGQMAQNIQEAESSNQLFYMVTKSYRLAFLKYAAGYLSERDAASALNFVWTTSEAPNSDPNLSRRELLALFRSVSPSLLMDKEELQVYEELPDLVTVYRGVTPYNAKMVKGLSWTLDRDTAEWFAHRYRSHGQVYQAQIEKAHIHAIFLGRNEAEVIVDPHYLTNLAQAPHDRPRAGQRPDHADAVKNSRLVKPFVVFVVAAKSNGGTL